MLERLEQLAREATLGKWHAPGLAELHDESHRVIGVFSDCDPVDEDERPVPSVAEGDRNAAYIAAANPLAVLKLIAVVKAAQRKMAAYDVLANKPIGEFTGNEVVACDEADDALRGALVELERP